MKTIIAGSRDFHDYDFLLHAIASCPFTVSSVVSGMAKGVDSLAVRYANETGLPLDKYPADWKKHGRAAGPIRNEVMAKNAEALIAIWDGKSRGTKNMIERAEKHGLRVYVARFER